MKILLVDDEPQILRGVSRIIACEQDEWEVETADSGEEALEFLSTHPGVEVVVSDMRMPGMDGAELLSQIGDLYPNILRVVLSGQADRDSVLRAVKPMHQYLSKPCEGGKLVEVINRAYIFQETIRSAEVLDAIGRANCLPTFPEIVNEINRDVELDSSSSKSISAIVSRDPVLSARALQLANSSIFSLRSTVSGVEKAISVIGVDMIRSLAMSQAVYGENQASADVLSAKELFEHSFKVAGLAKQLSRDSKLSLDDANMIFSAGLLHDVGKILLLNAFPEKYKSTILQAKSEGRPLADVEMENFDATHQGVGGYLLTLWGLPAAVVDAVASHHSFDECAKTEGSIRGFVFAANWIETNQDEETLNKLVEHSNEADAAQRFATRILDWQASLTQEIEA